MELKNIGKIVKGTLRGLVEGSKVKTPKDILQEEVIQPTESKELPKEEKMNQQAEKLVTTLQENPEMQQPLVQAAVKSPEISQEVIDKSAQIAAGSPEVPDNVTGTLVKKASDEVTMDILQNEGISSDTVRMGVIDSLKDYKKKEDVICNELKELYEGLTDLQSEKTIIKRLKKCLHEVQMERTSKINEVLYKIIAKAFAIQYCELEGFIRISTMEEILSIDEMINTGMPQRIEEEYKYIKVKPKPKEKGKFQFSGEKKPYNLEYVTKLFLGRMDIQEGKAGKGSYVTTKTSKLDMGETEENQGNITDIGKQEKGNLDLSTLKPEEIETIQDCIESGFIKNLAEFKPGMREKLLDFFKGLLGQRTSKTVRKPGKPENPEKLENPGEAKIEDTPKVKKAEWGDDPR